MSELSNDRLPREDTVALLPALAEDLAAAGAVKEKTEHFLRLLKECNVQTHGALRLFAADLQNLVNMMFDLQTPMGPLMANGFLAAVRVRYPQTRRPPHSQARGLSSHRESLVAYALGA